MGRSQVAGFQAVARLRNREEVLVYKGDTQEEVEAAWKAALPEVLAPELYPKVSRIAIQEWAGKANGMGRFVDVAEVVVAAGGDKPPPKPPAA